MQPLLNDYSDKHRFHDNMVHGVHLVGEKYTSEIHLDIDHIVQWPCDANTGLFLVSRALLKFYDVTDLFLNIDWGLSGYTTSVLGVNISTVECEKIDTTLRFPAYYKWLVSMSDGRSKISFGASRMSVDLIGNSLSVDRQNLLESERQ